MRTWVVPITRGVGLAGRVLDQALLLERLGNLGEARLVVVRGARGCGVDEVGGVDLHRFYTMGRQHRLPNAGYVG
jgi:hypothetical protein